MARKRREPSRGGWRWRCAVRTETNGEKAGQCGEPTGQETALRDGGVRRKGG